MLTKGLRRRQIAAHRADLRILEGLEQALESVAIEARVDIGDDHDVVLAVPETQIDGGALAAAEPQGQRDVDGPAPAQIGHDARHLVARAVVDDDDLAARGVHDGLLAYGGDAPAQSLCFVVPADYDAEAEGLPGNRFGARVAPQAGAGAQAGW